MKKAQICTTSQTVLEEETISFGGMLLKYQFLVSGNQDHSFAVRISSGNEVAETVLGTRLSPAFKLYHAIVRGRVTPCCLAEVVSDQLLC